MTDAVPPAAPPAEPSAAQSRWRSYGLPLLGMLAWFAAFTALYGLLTALTAGADRVSSALAVLVAVLAAAVFVAVYRVFVRRAEDRDADEVGPPAVRDLGTGLAVGALAFSAAVGLLVLAGVYSVGAGEGLSRSGTALAVAVVSGVCEEVLFRGILFRRLSAVVGSYGALAGSSLFFGFAHLANPGATLQGAAAIALEAGVMLGLAYVATGRLWLPIGLHIAWNYVQGGVFGVAVSGNDVGGSLLVSTPEAGRDALTGGAFGVEASPAAVLVCLVVSAVLLVVVRRRGLVVQPAWRRPAAGQTVSSTLPM